MDTVESILQKLKLLVVGLLVLTVFFLLSILLTTLKNPASQAAKAETPAKTILVSDDPNAVAGGLNAMLIELDVMTEGANKSITAAAKSTSTVIGGSARTAASVVASGARLVATIIHMGVTYTAYNVRTSLTLLARGVGGSLAFMFYASSSALGLVSNSPVVAAVAKPPAGGQIPVIVPGGAAQFAAVAAMPALQASSQQPAQAVPNHADWPLHGQITTLFGVPHWPFQPTHTGLDISSGNGSGVAKIKPFRAGKVVDVVFSQYGLGNNVVVDHGNGLTSVYAHLYSISVQNGQVVDTNTVLGTEGSTGASTGPHLHLEIRVNGQPVNPRDYISGQP